MWLIDECRMGLQPIGSRGVSPLAGPKLVTRLRSGSCQQMLEPASPQDPDIVDYGC